jgi:hypothetical protein
MCASSSSGGSVPCPFQTTIGTSQTSHAAIQQMSSSWYHGVNRAASHSSQSSTFGATTERHATGFRNALRGHGSRMAAVATAETARSRRRLVEEAGWRTTSGISVLAGVLVAFGAVTLIAAAAGAAGSALGLDTEGISTDEWRRAGIATSAIGALVVFGSFFFGGYTAGRMSRRAGARHGLYVFLLSVCIIGVIALVGWAMRGDLDVASSLRDEGVPTGRSTWGDIGLAAGIAAGVAMLLGSLLGGIRGDRWHTRLASAVIEHREEVVREEMERTRHQSAVVGDTPVDRTASIDLRDDETADPTTDLSVEEERDRQHSSWG